VPGKCRTRGRLSPYLESRSISRARPSRPSGVPSPLPRACRFCVQGEPSAVSPNLEHWRLIHDQGTEASAAVPHTGCLFAGSKRHVQTRDRGGSGSWRETIITGRVLAASPRSASQISPGWGFIKQVEDLLLGDARARDIEDVVIGELHQLSDARPASAAVSGFHSRNRPSSFSANASMVLLPSLLV